MQRSLCLVTEPTAGPAAAHVPAPEGPHSEAWRGRGRGMGTGLRGPGAEPGGPWPRRWSRTGPARRLNRVSSRPPEGAMPQHCLGWLGPARPRRRPRAPPAGPRAAAAGRGSRKDVRGAPGLAEAAGRSRPLVGAEGSAERKRAAGKSRKYPARPKSTDKKNCGAVGKKKKKSSQWLHGAQASGQ